MKIALVLTVIALVLCCSASGNEDHYHAKHHNKHHAKHHSKHHSKNRSVMHFAKQNREKEICIDTCDGKNPIPGTNNWMIQLNINIWLIFNSDKNTVGIINTDIKMAIVLDGSGFMFVFHYQLGVGILVDMNTTNAVYIDGLAKFDFSLQINFYKNFASISDIITAKKGLLSGIIDITKGNYFSFDMLMKLIASTGSIDSLFTNRLQLLSNLKLAFGSMIISLVTSFSKGLLDYSVTGFMSIFSVFLEIGSLRLTMLEFFANIGLKLKGRFTIELFGLLKSMFKSKSIAIELPKLNIALWSVGTTFSTLSEALTGYLTNKLPTASNYIQKIGNYNYRIITSYSATFGTIEIRGTGTMTGFIVIVFSVLPQIIGFYSSEGYVFLFRPANALTFPQALYSVNSGVGLAITSLNRGQSFTTNSANIINNFNTRQYYEGCKLIHTTVSGLSVSLLSQISVADFLQGKLTSNALTKQFESLINQTKSSYNTLLFGGNAVTAMFKLLNITSFNFTPASITKLITSIASPKTMIDAIIDMFD